MWAKITDFNANTYTFTNDYKSIVVYVHNTGSITASVVYTGSGSLETTELDYESNRIGTMRVNIYNNVSSGDTIRANVSGAYGYIFGGN